MSYFRKKLLLFIMLSLLLGSGYLLFIRTAIDPTTTEDSLTRVYENFLHKTKYSYEIILNSGTDYSNQERAYVELTKKMQALKNTQGDDYKALRDLLMVEIKKNENAFRSFYLKVTKTTPEELQKLVEERNQQFDIILESKD